MRCRLSDWGWGIDYLIMSPPSEGEGWHIAFGGDPIGIGVAHCLHSIYWTNRWILTKLAQTHYWKKGKKWIDFGDLYLIFKVTPTLWNFQILTKTSLCAPCFLNQLTVSGQTSYIVKLGWFKDLIRFWWPWPDFLGQHTIKTKIFKFWPKNLVCTLSLEPNDGFWPNFMYCNVVMV